MTDVACRRCLLKDLPEDEYYHSVYDYISVLSDGEKVSDDEYIRRLGICRSCGHLYNGLCALCGCFVEMRAVKRLQHCPKDTAAW